MATWAEEQAVVEAGTEAAMVAMEPADLAAGQRVLRVEVVLTKQAAVGTGQQASVDLVKQAAVDSVTDWILGTLMIGFGVARAKPSNGRLQFGDTVQPNCHARMPVRIPKKTRRTQQTQHGRLQDDAFLSADIRCTQPFGWCESQT